MGSRYFLPLPPPQEDTALQSITFFYHQHSSTTRPTGDCCTLADSRIMTFLVSTFDHREGYLREKEYGSATNFTSDNLSSPPFSNRIWTIFLPAPSGAVMRKHGNGKRNDRNPCALPIPLQPNSEKTMLWTSSTTAGRTGSSRKLQNLDNNDPNLPVTQAEIHLIEQELDQLTGEQNTSNNWRFVQACNGQRRGSGARSTFMESSSNDIKNAQSRPWLVQLNQTWYWRGRR